MAKILIIDDDMAICELVKINLELQGHNCLYSTDPTRGFALIKQENPALVILDVMMQLNCLGRIHIGFVASTIIHNISHTICYRFGICQNNTHYS